MAKKIKEKKRVIPKMAKKKENWNKNKQNKRKTRSWNPNLKEIR